jgi:adenylylsulfate reductase subunit B
MPTFVNPDKCDGCRALDRPACMYICPNDLMTLDRTLGKAFNQEPDLCWECYACVKTCPQTAIDMRGYGDVMPMGASLTPLRGTDSIMWTVKFRNGQLKRFKYPIRTTPWGSIDPFGGLPDPDPAELKGPGLAGQAKFLGVPQLPALAKP